MEYGRRRVSCQSVRSEFRVLPVCNLVCNIGFGLGGFYLKSLWMTRLGDNV